MTFYLYGERKDLWDLRNLCSTVNEMLIQIKYLIRISLYLCF